MIQDYIHLKGVRVNNLKSIDLKLKRGDFVVLTGVSGSGKSSLAFETLFAEGQRKYIESLSTYARQFIDQLPKPDADSIEGICPTLAIEQKKSGANKRSIVATSTEIYEYLKLLFARIGKTYAPESGSVVNKHTVQDVIDYIYTYAPATRFSILSPLSPAADRILKTELKLYLQKGFGRVQVEDQIYFIEDILKQKATANLISRTLKILIYRNKVGKHVNDDYQRLAHAIDSAFFEGQGICFVEMYNDEKTIKTFSNKFEADGQTFEIPSLNMFNFNNSLGACSECEGTGMSKGIVRENVILDPNVSIQDPNCLAKIERRQIGTWLQQFSIHATGFPLTKPYRLLSQAEQDLIWYGNEKVQGLYNHLENLQDHDFHSYLSFRGKVPCSACNGTRLRHDTAYVKVGHKTISDLVQMQVEELDNFLNSLTLEPHELKIAKIIKAEISLRTRYLRLLGLGYLRLDRLTHTLSGGEYQRIQLASSLGKGLVSVMYILDEPSIGLHPRDIERLIKVIKDLQAQDNTVVVVEHEEEIMRAADYIVDIGPGAGHQGGKIVFQGSLEKLRQSTSLTAQYLTKRKSIPVPTQRRKFEYFIRLNNVHHNNIKQLNVDIPLEVLVAVTGVSGSGKSTLIVDVLNDALSNLLDQQSISKYRLENITFDPSLINTVEYISQNPIGRSSRSNCATYIGAWDAIRVLFSKQALAVKRSYSSSFFSFNSLYGLCSECEGTGVQKIDMRFMETIELTCETCKGKRFMKEILEVTYKGNSIHDILQMTVDEAIFFFKAQPKILKLLNILRTVGLGYMTLGQSSPTFSGGEAQRLKIASYLLRSKPEPSLFIFDEPSTGLHFEDINKLLKAFEALLAQGHSIIVIEHNLDIIKSADWVIDMGPESGDQGGKICFQGPPEDLVNVKDNLTGKYLGERIRLKEKECI